MAGEAARLTGVTAGGYEIGEAIGRGGMGEVYRARHDRLDKAVAIKTLPDRLVRDRLARERFLRESKVASRIDHPYVATVFDLVEHGDDLLLVMELVEGRTLRERLREERLSTEQVRRYGSEIADALAAIHRAGLVHRDLKPSNVMITPDDHVKVMDFGVAQPAAPVVAPDAPTSTETLSEIDRAGGTPMYMSPEQLRGRAVDERSDLFALGVVLYEAITGDHPFARESLVDTMSAIIHEPPGRGTEPDTLTASGPLRHIVTRLLEKEPRRRYQSAEIALEHLKAASSAPEAMFRTIEPERSTRTSPWAWGVPAAAVVLLLVALAWAFTSGRIMAVDPATPAGIPVPGLPAAAETRPALAVLPFSDETGEDSGASRGRMLAALLSTELSDSDVIRPLDPERVDEVAKPTVDSRRRDTVARLREYANADYVIAGRIFKDGASYHATVDIYGDGGDEPVDSFRVSSGRVAGLASATLVPLIASLAPASESPTAPELTVLTSQNEEALVDYYRASESMREERYGAALDSLRSAVALDPAFVDAHIRLAYVLHHAGFLREARGRIGLAERALEARANGGSDLLRLRLDAAKAMIEDNKDDRLAVEARLVQRRPDAAAPRRAYAFTLVQDGQRDRAVAVAEQAIALDPQDPRNLLALAGALEASNRLDEARRITADAERIYRDLDSPAGLASVEQRRGTIAWSDGDYERAEAHFRLASDFYATAELDVLSAVSLSAAGDALLSRGEYAAAQEIYDRVYPIARRSGHHRLSITVQSHSGVGLLNLGRMGDAEPWLRGAVEEARLIENDELLLFPLLNLGVVLSHAGKHSESSEIFARAMRLATDLNDHGSRLFAGTYLADGKYRLGRLDEALAEYESLDAFSRTFLRVDDAGRVRDDNLPDVVSMLGGKLTLLHVMGRFEMALEVAERVVSLAEQLGRDNLTAQALHMRAALFASLADYGAAEADLRRATEMAADDGGALIAVDASVRLVRAMIALQRGDAGIAESLLAPVRAVAEKEKWQDAWVPILSVSSNAATMSGRQEDAERWARRGTREARAGVVEKLYARLALAEAHARRGTPEATRAAAEEASILLDEARGLDQHLAVVRAAAVIHRVEAARDPGKAARAKEEAAAALEEFMARVPARFRDGVAARVDLRTPAAELGLVDLVASSAPRGTGASP